MLVNDNRGVYNKSQHLCWVYLLSKVKANGAIGIGKSDKPLARYTTDGMAKDLIEVIDHLGWTQERELNIVGVSMGGMIAQELVTKPLPTRKISQ